jgi:hypothetical protein
VWGERRKSDPVLRAVINVLCERGLIQDLDDICGSHYGHGPARLREVRSS